MCCIIIVGEVTKELSNTFFLDSIQDILLKLTHVDVQKAFRKRFIGEDPDTPIYKFMTTAEVEKVSLMSKIAYYCEICLS